MITLKKDDINRIFDVNYYSRGLNYQKQGKVGKLKLTEGKQFVHITASVKGSGRNSYIANIDIKWHGQAVIMKGYCSCPIGYQCKHVVAVCLEYASLSSTPKKTKTNKQACLDWLQDLSSVQPQVEPIEPKSSDAEFVAYLVRPSNKNRILTLDFVISRPLKSSKGFAKGRPLSTFELTHDHHYTEPYISDIDKQIGNLLKACTGKWGTIELSGEAGHLALQHIINTGRAFWKTTKGVKLIQGTEREITSKWLSDKTGSSLEINISPDANILLTDPPLYLDPITLKVGSIKGQLSLYQLQKLLKAPVIPKSLQKEISRQLLTNFPELPIPPLVKIKTHDIIDTAAKARLIIYGEDTSQSELSHHLCLRFIYKGIEVQASGTREWSTVEKKGDLWRIQHDFSSELSFEETLQDLAFSPINEHPKKPDILLSPSGTHTKLEAIEKWQYFLENSVPQLQEQGWDIVFDPSFKLEFLSTDDNWHVNIEEEEGNQNDWFDLRFDLPVTGENQDKIPLLPLITQLLTLYKDQDLPDNVMLPLDDYRYIPIQREKIQPILNILYELYESHSLNDDSLRLSRHDAARLHQLDENSDHSLLWLGGDELRTLGKKLNDFKGIQNVKPPKTFNATLRAYQQQGLNWLQFLREYEFGGILADDMGLGKTVQTLAHLLFEQKRLKKQGTENKPSLILAPTSLMGNWRREAEQFAPDLKVLVLHGPNRKSLFDKIGQYDLILTTYPLLVRDQEFLTQQSFHYLVLDEAQVIKNPKAKAAKVARDINARHRLCLTGTPMENHLGELWALFDFLMPGFLREERHFKQVFRTPIEKQGDDTRRQQLANRVKPFMLRRTKQEVATELPQKTEIIRSVSLESQQAALYESIRLSMEKKVQEAIASKGLARSHITILDALLKLRQTCCDPQLLSLEQAAKVKESAKMELLMTILPEMVEEGRKILLFSQFTKMLGLIEEKLKQQNISYSKLTGQTRKRDEAIQAFTQGDADVFLISLKAGGVGLNLTEADTVIHYDPWWNPAAEKQATDRAYRIGQDKPVFVYKLITENTVEEKIIAMQERKQALADGIYSGKAQGEESKLTADDLKELLAPL